MKLEALTHSTPVQTYAASSPLIGELVKNVTTQTAAAQTNAVSPQEPAKVVVDLEEVATPTRERTKSASAEMDIRVLAPATTTRAVDPWVPRRHPTSSGLLTIPTG